MYSRYNDRICTKQRTSLKVHILWSKPIPRNKMIHQNLPTCCLQVITSVLFLSQMRLDSTILHNLVSWQGRERESVCERERKCVSFWPILLAIFPVKQMWEGVQRQPGPLESRQALCKWCYHNTFVFTPSVSLTRFLTPVPHPSSSFIIFFSPCFTIHIGLTV